MKPLIEPTTGLIMESPQAWSERLACGKKLGLGLARRQ